MGMYKYLTKWLISFLAVFMLAGSFATCRAEVPATAGTARKAAGNPMQIRVGLITSDCSYYYDEDGKLCGYDIDYMNRIAKETGWKYEYVLTDNTNQLRSFCKTAR